MNLEHIPIERLIDYLHRELAPEDDARVLAHIDTCATCRNAYDEEAQLSDQLHLYAQNSECDLPPGLATRIRAHVEEIASPSWWMRLRLAMRPLVALPVGAALGVALYFTAVSLHRGTLPSSIGAVYYLEDYAALTNTVPFASSGSVVPATLANDNDGADQEWIESSASASNGSP